MKTINLVTKSIILLSFIVINKLHAGIEFKTISFSQAKTLAAKENKLIFIDAYATWCGPCKWMASNVFTDQAVGKYFSDHFIALKIDMESDKGSEINELYTITAYPTLLAISPDGKLLRKQVGALDAEEILSWADYCLHPENSPYEKALKKYENGQKDLTFLIDFLVTAYEEEKPYDYLVPEIFKILPMDSLITPSGFMMLRAFPQDYSSEYTQHFFKNFNDFYAIYGDDAFSTYEQIINSALEEKIITHEVLTNQIQYNFNETPEVLEYFLELINTN